MFKKFKETFGKKILVIVMLFIGLIVYTIGFREGKMRKGNVLTTESSFFDRNQKEIGEGFKKYVEEEDDRVTVKNIEYKKGEIRVTIELQENLEYSELEYVLTEDKIQGVYKANFECSEDKYKQLVVNGEFDLK